MKKSIAKTIIFRILLISLCVAVGVCMEVYIFLQNLIFDDVQKYGLSFVSQFSNTVKICWDNDGYLSDEKKLFLKKELQALCNSSKADYMYVYVPYIETNEVKYILTAKSETKLQSSKSFEAPFVEKNCTFSNDEIEVWNGTKDVAYRRFDNDYGKEYTILIRLNDDDGNRLAMVGVDFSYEEMYKKIDDNFLILTLLVLILIVIFNILLYRTVKKRIIEPTKEISKSMGNFISCGEKSKIKIDKKRDDEFSLMAKAFNDMADDIDDYINNIKSLTQEQAQQEAELEIAANVQKGLLPKEIFDTDTYKINAVMYPAKNIGGDLYDFFKLDEENILLVIADVSGKGLPAAMFMSVTLTLIRQFAQMKYTPSDILKNVNNSLNENNPQLLFVTVFIGIYNSKNKTFTYANAGHNLPYILRNNDLILLDKAKGIPLGMFEDESYEQFCIKLYKGDIIYMYTDGVNEAVNVENEFFGAKRLESLLKNYTIFRDNSIISYVKNSLKEFSKNAIQHDDITMLTLCVHDKIKLKLNADSKEFDKIKKAILQSDIPQKLKLKLCLVAEEIFVNICSYAYSDVSIQSKTIEFQLIVSDKIIIQFIDNGKEYNPLKEIVDIDTYDIDEQVGGLGKFITFNIADNANYQYKDNKNILTIVKYIEEDKNGDKENK